MSPARLLVTGFGPFPGAPRNPSAEAARRIAVSPRWRLLGIEVQALVLPTTYAALDGQLAPALRDGLAGGPPDAVLMIGLARRSRQVRVETRGLNRVSRLAPDAAKTRPERAILTPGAGPRRSATKPLQQVTTLQRHGFRTRASIDAGRYLCNASYFVALAEPMPVLFIHVPRPGRALVRKPHRRVRQSWAEQLASALTAVALDVIAQSRRSRTPAGPSSG